jgi:methylthioxylose transferase
VLFGAASSLAAAGCIAARRLIIGSAEGGWVYPYVDSIDGGSVLGVFALSCLVVGAGIGASWRLLRRFAGDSERAVPRDMQWALILVWCVVAMPVQGVLRSTTPHSLGAIVESDTANSFYSVAVRTNARSILSRFESRRHTWALHARSNLPGKLLVVRALTRISDQPEVVAWLIIALSNLGALLLYVFVRDVSGDRFVAGLSAILYLFTPAKLYFVPLLNVVTPVAVLTVACLTIRWLATGRIIYSAALGVAVYGLALFEPTALVAGVLFAALVLHRVVSRLLPSRTVVLHMGTALLAFGAIYAAMIVWFGFDLFRSFRAVAHDATEFNAGSGRPYMLWVRQNLFDFVFGVGWCQTALFAAALTDGIVRWQSRWRATDMPPIVLICFSVLAMVGIADAIGINRGEVIRLWIFLACLAQIPAAYVCRRLNSVYAFGVVVVATLLQDALGIAMITFVAPS